MSRVRVFILVLILSATTASARNVWFVDNSAPAGGNGSADRPFVSMTVAEQRSQENDIIYVHEGHGPYDESVTLKPRQLLIGSAYGLDAVRVDLGVTDFTAPPTPRVQGPGPAIHGSIWLPGFNVLAGFTVTADKQTAVGTSSPVGPIRIRNVYVRPSKKGSGLYIQNALSAVSIEGGGLEGADEAGGVGIDGGTAEVMIDHFPITGTFSTAVLIRNHSGGAISFRRGSRIHVAGTTRDAIVLTSCGAGTITFDDPIQIDTHGGRAVVVSKVHRVVFGGGDNRVETVNAAAIDFADAGIDGSFVSVSASGVAPGKLVDGVSIVHIKGRFAITGEGGRAGSGGTIRNAASYGLRLEQSENLRIAGVTVADSGTTGTCAGDLQKEQNVRCRAGVYLRHVSHSRLEDIAVSGGSGAGVNGNNVSDVTFDGLQITGSGESSADAALTLQEVVGTISFSRCRITDGGGGELMIEQRFNGGRVSFERCAFAAPQRPAAAPYLIRVLAAGTAKVDVDLRGAQFEDNNGGAVAIDAGDGSSVSLAITDAVSQRLGGGILDVAAHHSAHAAVAMHGTQIIAPGVRSGALVNIAAGRAVTDSADACVDIASNTFTTGSGAFPVRMAQKGHGSLRVLVPGAGDDSKAIAEAVGQQNGGAAVQIEGAATRAGACR